MEFQTVLITGGAGFIGSSLAFSLREAWPELKVLAMDNLKRRGSELNLPRLLAAGVEFSHGDVRSADDFSELPRFDVLIDCSGEPSVHAGQGGSPRAVLDTNLFGTLNCLEAARVRGAAFLFLSTSRIYPIGALNNLPFTETATRFRWDDATGISGFSSRGIAESFTLDGPRSFYGTSKLAGEQLIKEYVFSYRMRALIDRCGVVAGPWQMGKVDQGVITLWVARHYFGRPLSFTGFGGTGKQVRDVLHVQDLIDLIKLQLEAPSIWDGRIYNAGGGTEGAVSLLELTRLCADETGRTVPIAQVAETAGVDLRIYVTDNRKAEVDFGWCPQRGPARIVRDLHEWIAQHAVTLEKLLT
jgi:CDP-paratose 2-epimerase